RRRHTSFSRDWSSDVCSSDLGDKIGHPSCEGGKSTGTHLHITRKYNGEWVPAEGPLAFVMSGWKTKASSESLAGWLVKGEEVIRSEERRVGKEGRRRCERDQS